MKNVFFRFQDSRREDFLITTFVFRTLEIEILFSFGSLIKLMSNSAAERPISNAGCATVLKGGFNKPAIGKSENPINAISCGMDKPASVMAA